VRRTTLHHAAPPFSNYRGSSSSVELGIQTAQALMNDKKRGQLKDRLQQKFPLVPAGFLDAIIDAVAAGFTRVAPTTLKRALTPGGMEQVRPVLKQSMVDAVRDQRAFRDLPVLSEKDKIRLMEVAIDLALDQALRESEWILSTPQVRLEALQDEIREILTTELTWTQRAWYRYRRHPRRYALIVTVVSLNLYTALAHGGSYPAALQALAAGAVGLTKVMANAVGALGRAAAAQIAAWRA